MGVWRGEYTDWEWLQLAACLLGTPLAALLGAWQAGYSRPGRNLVRCVLIGLLAAAGVGGLFLIPVLAWGAVIGGSQSPQLIRLFDQGLATLLCCFAVCAALLAANYFGHVSKVGDGRREVRRGVTLRQFFLLQLLPFVVLGCWLGMRSTALNVSSGLERAQRKWSARGWEVHTDEKEQLLGLSRNRPYLGMDQAEENLNLREAARERWVKELRFGVASDPAGFDFGCFSRHPALTDLHVTYAYGSLLSTKHLKDLASISSLEFLHLKSAGSDSESLAPLAAAAKLERLSIETLTIDPQDFNGLKACKALKVLSISELTPTSLVSIEFPESLEELTLDTRFLWKPSVENFRAMKNLRHLALSVGCVTNEEIAVIAAAPNLETLYLGEVISAADVQLLLRSPRLHSLQFGYRADSNGREEALFAAIEQLSIHPTLATIECGSMLLRMKKGTGEVTLALDEQKVAGLQARIASIRKERGLSSLEVQFLALSPYAYYNRRVAYKKPNLQGGRP